MIERQKEEFLSNRTQTFQLHIPYLLRFLLNMQVSVSVSYDKKSSFYVVYILS